MEKTIQAALAAVEREEGCRVLLAVESGSRAWGFASPDSDYDVRFFYVRPWDWYLRLERRRDVIERPITDLLDMNGWDLQKALTLLHGANPTVFEWLASPVVYRETPFAKTLQEAARPYFSVKKSLWHYLHMAERNYREYLRGDLVRAKKYFYVLRPVLACRWVLDRGAPPPMEFEALAAACLPPALGPLVEALLTLKRAAPEKKEIPRVEPLNRYLEESLAELRAIAAALPREPARGWEGLDRLFLAALSHETE